jgi:hypothetical protein
VEQEEDLLVGTLEENPDSDGIAPLAAEGP